MVIKSDILIFTVSGVDAILVNSAVDVKPNRKDVYRHRIDGKQRRNAKRLKLREQEVDSILLRNMPIRETCQAIVDCVRTTENCDVRKL